MSNEPYKTYLQRMRGGAQKPARASWTTLAWSWIGGFIGIVSVVLISRWSHLNDQNQLYLVGSFGASAVLLYGAPQSDFAQPRNLLGGHILSAFIGVSVYFFIPVDIVYKAALAVAFAIVFMQLTETLHPPGGATSLIAVIGSAQIHNAGYWFVLNPIASGAIVMLVVALLVNNASQNPARHYPRFWW